LLGYPSSTTTENRQEGHFRLRTKYSSLFFQDDWNVTRNLTLNLGVRWEATTPRTEDNDLQTVFNLQTLRVDVASLNGYPRTLHDYDWNNFSPRFGFAWSARNNFVVRGGYGVFFLPTDVMGNSFLTPGPAQATLTYVANGATNLFPVTFANFGTTAKLPELVADVPVTPNTSVSWMPRSFPNAYQQQWNINLQRQWGSMLFEAAYVGNHGSHLEFSRALNTIPLERLTAPGYTTLQSRRVYPGVGNIGTARSDPMGDSNYHALQTRVQRRYSQGIAFTVAYTFSKTIDNASDVLAFRQVGIVSAQDAFNLRAERSLATFHRAHALAGEFSWELPVGKGRRFLSSSEPLDAVLGGWNLGGIASAYTGLPLVLSVANANAITNTMGGGLRPNRLACGALPESSRSIDGWFDLSAFAAPSPNTFGNTSRTEPCAQAPGLANFDLLLAKQFRIGEKAALTLRGEFANAFNHFNPGSPNTAIGNQNAGRITSTKTAARVIQISLRLKF
jgi:hypothetical protein